MKMRGRARMQGYYNRKWGAQGCKPRMRVVWVTAVEMLPGPRMIRR
jgi:hypothetical protein